MRIVLLAGLAVLIGVLLIVSLAACHPNGEEGQWRTLVKLLGPPGTRPAVQIEIHQFFPDTDDPEKAEMQFQAIRTFAKAHPQSLHLNELLDGYLLPNLHHDLHGGVPVGKYRSSSQHLSLLAWELHLLSPERRLDFKQTLFDKLASLPDSGRVVRWLGEQLGDAHYVSQGSGQQLVEEEARRKASFQEGLALLGELATRDLLSPGQRSLLDLLKTFASADDRLLVEVKETAAPGAVRQGVAWGLGGAAFKGGILIVSADAEGPPGTVRGRIVIEVEPEVTLVPIVIPRAKHVSTRSERVLAPKWSHGRRRFEYKWQERKEIITTGGSGSQDLYPAYRARISVAGPDGATLHTFTTSSSWWWNNIRHIGEEIVPGSEYPSNAPGDSGVNLGWRIGHELLGKPFLEKFY